jgi:hypothetical protein
LDRDLTVVFPTREPLRRRRRPTVHTRTAAELSGSRAAATAGRLLFAEERRQLRFDVPQSSDLVLGEVEQLEPLDRTFVLLLDAQL